MRLASLTKTHDRKRFDCGEPILNEWLQRQALQSQTKRTASTKVAVEHDESPVILGFYALSTTFVDVKTLPSTYKGLPPEVPAFILARLAVGLEYKGMEIGRDMLLDAFERTRMRAEIVGGIGLLVHAKPQAIGFYESFGFVHLLGSPSAMLLPFDD
ncbi:MAG: GNAT family N-acetyltransferase [Azoarcus sp.]|jgi:ribosomal protein S18 acetylase RimI-like enzyme|nr:GNAT family N-acetyltransferase [Azoarcus sp.]